ncbi:hypothetical protein HHI36_001514 [Cryptolaemus montrouzieri]|uniref:DUF4817 domain-containing protein n=1 Tax=Cryptolaemus montrouzieri TaxID=559131 RepID=A0ABD2P7U9_9CUCU
MHFIYGECGCNISAAARLYRERYPNAERHPDYRVRKSGGRPQADYEDMVLDEVENDAGTSVRAIEMNTGVPKSSAQRISNDTNTIHTTCNVCKPYYRRTTYPEWNFVEECQPKIKKIRKFWTKYAGRTKQHARKMASLTSITYMDGILRTHI